MQHYPLGSPIQKPACHSRYHLSFPLPHTLHIQSNTTSYQSGLLNLSNPSTSLHSHCCIPYHQYLHCPDFSKNPSLPAHPPLCVHLVYTLHKSDYIISILNTIKWYPISLRIKAVPLYLSSDLVSASSLYIIISILKFLLYASVILINFTFNSLSWPSPLLNDAC